MTTALRNQLERDKMDRPRLGGWLLIPLVILAVTVFVGARQWRDTLTIETVTVEGARILTAGDIVAMAAIEPPAYLYQADLFDARERLLRQPFIKSAAVIRALPRSLRISIVEREPIGSLAGSEIRYVDTERVLMPRLPSAAPLDLPLISGIKGIDTAAYGAAVSDSELVQAIDVLKAGQASGFYHAISEVLMTPGADILLYSTDGGVPVILGRGDMPKKLRLLQTFWSSFMKPESLALLQYVDARFNGQIVVKRAAARPPEVRPAPSQHL